MRNSRNQGTKEIEQRYILDPLKGLYLPREYQEYHQAEIGSGMAGDVIKTFLEQVDGILTGAYARHGREINALFSGLNTKQRIKIRVRRIFDPREHSLRAEFTLKEKLESGIYKVYIEHNISINDILGLSLIEHIAPPIKICKNIEFGVRKHRYHIAGPDGKKWDVDVLQGFNTGIFLGEIETPRKGIKVEIPPWAIRRVNGDKNYRFLGTASLQKAPWQLLSRDKQSLYKKAIGQ